MLVSSVCLFVCLSVCALASTIMEQSRWNFHRKSGLASSWNSRNFFKVKVKVTRNVQNHVMSHNFWTSDYRDLGLAAKCSLCRARSERYRPYGPMTYRFFATWHKKVTFLWIYIIVNFCHVDAKFDTLIHIRTLIRHVKFNCNCSTTHRRDIRLAPKLFVIAFAKSRSPIGVSRLSVCYFAKNFRKVCWSVPFVTLRKIFAKYVGQFRLLLCENFSQSMLVSSVCLFVSLFVTLRKIFAKYVDQFRLLVS